MNIRNTMTELILDQSWPSLGNFNASMCWFLTLMLRWIVGKDDTVMSCTFILMYLISCETWPYCKKYKSTLSDGMWHVALVNVKLQREQYFYDNKKRKTATSSNKVRKMCWCCTVCVNTYVFTVNKKVQSFLFTIFTRATFEIRCKLREQQQ